MYVNCSFFSKCYSIKVTKSSEKILIYQNYVATTSLYNKMELVIKIKSIKQINQLFGIFDVKNSVKEHYFMEIVVGGIVVEQYL